jgi:hypothetical protein
MAGPRTVDAFEAVDRPADLRPHVERRRPRPLDHHHPRRHVGKGAGIVGHHLAAHRMSDEDRPLDAQRPHEVVQVENEMPERVVGRGLAVAVPAQIDRVDAKPIEQTARQIVERMRMIAQPVHDDERRRAIVPPVAEVDAQGAGAEEAFGVHGGTTDYTDFTPSREIRG